MINPFERERRKVPGRLAVVQAPAFGGQPDSGTSRQHSKTKITKTLEEEIGASLYMQVRRTVYKEVG